MWRRKPNLKNKRVLYTVRLEDYPRIHMLGSHLTTAAAERRKNRGPIGRWFEFENERLSHSLNEIKEVKT